MIMIKHQLSQSDKTPMNSENNKSDFQYRGIGFGGMLAILFIGLKLTGNIDWSWWWVLSPLWIPVGIVLSLFALAGIFYLIAYALETKSNKPRNKYRGL
jgi:hypothetical protein